MNPTTHRRSNYALWCRELRSLLRAGMTVVEALDALCSKHAAKAAHQSTLSGLLLEQIRMGQCLSSALASIPHVPGVLVAAVKSGERTSSLVASIDEYLRFDDMAQAMRRKVTSAAIYPAVVSALGLAICVFLIAVVMPNFARMYHGLGGRGGLVTSAVVGSSVWVAEHRVLSFLAMGAATALAVWLIASGAAARLLDLVAVSVPWIRASIRDFHLAMTYQAIALLLRGGYPLVEAMAIAARSTPAHELADSLRAAREAVSRGVPVSAALASAAVCDEIDRRLMAAAERTGDFYLATEAVATLHRESFDSFIERATRIVEPALLFGVATLVGGIVVAMYLPVFDMATRLR